MLDAHDCSCFCVCLTSLHVNYYFVIVCLQDFQPQRLDDGYLEVIGLTTGTLVSQPWSLVHVLPKQLPWFTDFFLTDLMLFFRLQRVSEDMVKG